MQSCCLFLLVLSLLLFCCLVNGDFSGSWIDEHGWISFWKTLRLVHWVFIRCGGLFGWQPLLWASEVFCVVLSEEVLSLNFVFVLPLQSWLFTFCFACVTYLFALEHMKLCYMSQSIAVQPAHYEFIRSQKSTCIFAFFSVKEYFLFLIGHQHTTVAFGGKQWRICFEL